MNIAIGMKITQGPFGGGNQFGKYLSSFLQNLGHHVFFDLDCDKLDIILLTDPRTSMQSVTFGPLEIMRYVNDINSSVLLVQRINECDERKGTHGLNRLLSAANGIMDHTVFISSWLERLHRKQNLFTKNSSVIKNGADRSVFTYQRKQLPTDRKIRLVTHHWSANWNKGWDVYSHLDQLLATTNLGEQLEFSYIGNVPAKTSLKVTNIIPPLSGAELAQELHRHNVYISASVNEPAGMHHIEGALCGLPLLYRNSGALPEYCNGYGIRFDGVTDFKECLETLVEQYDVFAQHMSRYNHTSERMCQEYLDLFERILRHRDGILSHRQRKNFSLLHKFVIRGWQNVYRLTSMVE
ncbi:hypothetical protein HY630_01465 [Candidatus Uhrbacteria bacterium]|nr:hypothetical protein [Candidatus Uhrbacteria bacterium]